MKIIIASDHAGFPLKNQLVTYFRKQGIEMVDLGTDSAESVDYPDYAHLLAETVINEKYSIGIGICGSGNGINIALNKHQEIRSALCWNREIAVLARRHNDANVCALPGWFVSFEEAIVIIRGFMESTFEGGRHERRVRKISIRSNT